MREIKFRAWDKKVERMFVVGTLLDALNQGQEDEHWLLDTDHILMQYTGLKDKNEVEIYEGDIFYCQTGEDLPAGNYIVEFEEGAFIGRHLLGTLGEETWCRYWSETEIEVIGNIHENPELLK